MDYFELLKAIYDTGVISKPRGLETKELIDAKLIIDKYNFYGSEPARPLEKTLPYLYGELAWYFSGSRKAKDIAEFSKFWLKLQNPDGTVNSNYGYLVFYKLSVLGTYTAYNWALTRLQTDPSSRQAIILYNDRDFYYNGNKDYICTQLQHFFVRGKELTSIVYLRSSDAILGLTFDIPWWSMVQQQMALELGIRPGKITVNIGSVHIYENKYEMVKSILQSGIAQYYMQLNKPIPLGNGISWYVENLPDYLYLKGLQKPPGEDKTCH